MKVCALSAHPIIRRARDRQDVDVVTDRLLRPVGLQFLASVILVTSRDSRGDLRVRDAAYHQGTVKSWVIDPTSTPVEALPGCGVCEAHLSEACVGTIGENFDAEPPYRPRRCIAQAWSVAEVSPEEKPVP